MKGNGRDLFLFSCQDYFKHYSSKSVCFNGLNPYVYRLQIDQQCSLLSIVSQCIKEAQSSLGNGEVGLYAYIGNKLC